MSEQQEIAELKSQLIELQSQAAFQEDTINSLNDVVSRQQRQIENLAEVYDVLSKRFEASLDAMPGGDVDEKPPHY